MKYTLFLLLLTLISLFAQGQHRDSIAMYGTIDTVLVQEKQLDKAKDANAGTLNYFPKTRSCTSKAWVKAPWQPLLFEGPVLLTLVSTGMVSTSILPWQVPSTSHKFQSSSPTTWNYNMVLET